MNRNELRSSYESNEALAAAAGRVMVGDWTVAAPRRAVRPVARKSFFARLLGL